MTLKGQMLIHVDSLLTNALLDIRHLFGYIHLGLLLMTKEQSIDYLINLNDFIAVVMAMKTNRQPVDIKRLV